jgi:poly(glycerol-phosphate) alpha-glucosyltransferase
MFARADADLSHQHGIWLDDQWATLQWQKKTGKPVVISPHGMLDPWALKHSEWKKKLIRKVFADESLRRATCLHALCRSEAESIRALGLTNPIAIIPNGVSLPEINHSESTGRECATEDTRPKRLLFLGRIHPKKGLQELLEAWCSAPGEWRDHWKLCIAGWDDGGHEAKLKTTVSQYRLEESVEFTGPQFGAQKEQLLRNADAFILPSFSEGLPMSVLEAWAYGLPVVMTEHCNLPEGFAAAAAICVEPNPDSILQGIIELAGMPGETLTKMGSNGRQLVMQRFAWSEIADMMRSVYDWCITKDNPPSCMEFNDG